MADPEVGTAPAQTRPSTAKGRLGARAFRTLTRGLISGREPSPVSLAAIKRSRRDIIPRNKRLIFDIEKIVEVTRFHEKYQSGPTTLTGLAKFDDMHVYGPGEEAEKELIEAEIKRLVEAAEREDAQLFDSQGAFTMTDRDGFQDMSSIADQLLSNFEIIKQDNSLHALRYCPTRGELAVAEFSRSRKQLVARFQQEDSPVKGGEPKLLKDAEANKKAYFALVDFVTSSIAQLLVRSAFSYRHYWDKYIFAILASWSAKLKAISYNPSMSAQQSLNEGTDTLKSMVDETKQNETLVLHVRLSKDNKNEATVSTLETDSDVTTFYYEECFLLRYHLGKLFTHAVEALYSSEKSGSGAACFETGFSIYETGFEKTLTVVSSDRDGDVAASSQPSDVKCSWTALELVHRNTAALMAVENRVVHDEHAANIAWEWRKDIQSPPTGHLETSNPDELISILVPLALCSPWAAVVADTMIQLSSSGTDENDPIMQFEFPKHDCRASYSVSTCDFNLQERRLDQKSFHDPEVRSLTRSPLLRGIRGENPSLCIYKESPLIFRSKLAGSSVEKSLTGVEGDTSSSPEKLDLDRAAKRRKLQNLVFSEDSISYPCRRYVRTVLGIALTWVLGGMAVPFCVGERIRGVDPFQITTFIWVLAGFGLILAKSQYVSDWPWHDFLHSKVVCRSVSELNDVTGVDGQITLMYLLQEESRSILWTRGPYNGMFERKVKEGAAGFSIDIPIELSTLIDSGFVMLKVRNERGEHLVCLDVRKGNPAMAAVSGGTKSKTLLVEDISKDNSRSAMTVASPATNQNPLKNSAVQETRNSANATDGTSTVVESSKEKTVEKSTINEGRKRGWFRKAGKNELERPGVQRFKEVDFRWNKVLGIYVRDSQFG
ncbi:hypothetical protein BGZ57DRAFT_951891 [Hyaloscypha finlandica]|nr:hypothetical protein BGZ57DRAFT_951891 [Hyaloscypha finlandica]